MSDKNQEFPFRPLGVKLRGMREHLRESLAEVSGAVEIDVDMLVSYEQGTQRPSEDILLMLISHFAVKEDEASSLWTLAGYEPSNDMGAHNAVFPDQNSGVMLMPINNHILYTDMAHVMVNDHGVVINFMQTNGPNAAALPVSKVGMSKEHAENLIALLRRTIDSHGQSKNPKSLPANPDQSKKSSDI